MTPPKVIVSRVTIMDRATLYVTESTGDFASTVLETVVSENVPGHTHNPPTIILLESGINEDRETDLPLTEMTPLAQAAYGILVAHLEAEVEAYERAQAERSRPRGAHEEEA